MELLIPRQSRHNYSIKGVENSMLFLKALCEEDCDLSITRLSKKLKITKNKTFRMMATFEKLGYVEQINSFGQYRLGYAASLIGNKLLSRCELVNKAKSVMKKLAFECGETVYLAINNGQEFVLMEKEESSNPVKIISMIGKRYSFVCNTIGNIGLASDSGLNEHCAPDQLIFSEKNANVISPGEFSVEVGGLGDCVASLSVPIINGQNMILGCLCFVIPEFRFNDKIIQSMLLPKLRAACQTIASDIR